MSLVLRGVVVSVPGHGSDPDVGGDSADSTRRDAMDHQAEGRGVGADRATPPELLLGTVRHPSLRLRAPVVLRVECRGDMVTVQSDELAASGNGAHVTAAIEDLQRRVAAMYLSLRGEQAHVNADVERQWTRIRRWIEERR